MISFQYSEISENGVPLNPKLLHIRPEISWEFLVEQRRSSDYTLAIGNTFGSSPKCKGCGKRFTDRNEVRIRVYGVFTPPNAAPYMNKVNMCVNMICVEKALRKTERFVFPKFTGSVKVPFQLKTSMNFDASAVEGINWVYEDNKEQ